MLAVTDAGKGALETETKIVREHLRAALTQWKVWEITALADMVNRFLEDLQFLEIDDAQFIA
jgi:hypothetical protein